DRDARRRGDRHDEERNKYERDVPTGERARPRERAARARGEAARVHREREARRPTDRGDEQAERAAGQRGEAAERAIRLDPTSAPREPDGVPLPREEREEAERRERADDETRRRVDMFDEPVGELGRIDGRDREHSGDADADEAKRDGDAARDPARTEERVEQTDARRADEERDGAHGERSGRKAAHQDGDGQRDEDDRA